MRYVFSAMMLCCMVFFCVHVQADDQPKNEAAFQDYVKGLKSEAIDRGYDKTWLEKLLKEVTFRPTVVKADNNQPEKKITLDSYLATRVPDWKVDQAVAMFDEHRALLEKIGRDYAVQPRFIVALWGNESNFGKIQGKHDVLSALASLAFEGRREALFKKQFFAALQILEEGHVEKARFVGSWAGAMGQSQFMPTSFLTYAVDYNGDGKKDIWGTPADVFASIANFLHSEGWKSDYTWGRQVTLHENYIGEHAGLKTFDSLQTWQSRGVRRYDGSDLPQADIKASLIMPDGLDGRVYLVYNNFHTLMKWNRSTYFGVSVGYLSDRIKKGH
ncbi:lytic murein transglycosylase [Salinimonas chungwhensis]|uniref:lytic murein transglycosylase n=1 Tax=Salinimonas chungwhensis TaxID=265425 RepID=UPI00036A8163